MAISIAAFFAADTVLAARRVGEEFQQVYPHQVNESTWCMAGGGRQPDAAARVRVQFSE